MSVCPLLCFFVFGQSCLSVWVWRQTTVCTGHAGQSVDQHFLASYYHAILSIILAQFSGKGFDGGRHGVIKLAQASPYIRVTTCAEVLVMQGCPAKPMVQLLAEHASRDDNGLS